MTPATKSILFEAAAGSGKTTKLVKLALASPEKRFLFTTFTDENTEEIGTSLLRENGSPPQNIDLMPWFTFLLRHCVNPFLWHAGFGLDSISGMLLVNCQSALRTRRDSVEHYISREGKVYSDKLAELAMYIDAKTNGAVLARLNKIYDQFYIDEAQDLSGYDLELIQAMLKSGMSLTMACDQRQATYHTNNTRKNAPYRELGLGRFIMDRRLMNDCAIDGQSLSGCHRCNQAILDIANSLYPNFTASESIREKRAEDDLLPPVHVVLAGDVDSYIRRWKPAILRDSAKTHVPEAYLPQNFGASKGRTYDRVLIYPTNPIRKWLRNNSTDLSSQTRAKFYVALTRARYSVAFVGSKDLAQKAGYPLIDAIEDG